MRIGFNVGNFVVIGLAGLTGALIALALLQLWATSGIPGSGFSKSLLTAVGSAFNYAGKGL